jgi:hypothetical protein
VDLLEEILAIRIRRWLRRCGALGAVGTLFFAVYVELPLANARIAHETRVFVTAVQSSIRQAIATQEREQSHPRDRRALETHKGLDK